MVKAFPSLLIRYTREATMPYSRRFCTLLLMCWPGVAFAQVDQSRRRAATPGLMLDTGSRTAACDVLTFTNNGQYLLAAGDDRVVRTWRFTGKGLEQIVEPTAAGVPSRCAGRAIANGGGNIYAAAVSPDAQGTHIAIGGTGIRNSQFAVLDRFTGQIKQAVPYLSAEKAGGFSIWSVAFAPTGAKSPAAPTAAASGSGTGKPARNRSSSVNIRFPKIARTTMSASSPIKTTSSSAPMIRRRLPLEPR